ncbi:SGNH/GDSL hydrolase family protein [Lacticaseibacillus paracasei]|uniref:SGNH/GDSL hydrolase family protein n=1 Tax=Lacticaseibacillus paracasei TaxID=1597 RepID=UPI0021A8D6AD|nr:acyltransferase [Lacticaseibacillus paracasei]MCT3378002.1 acyltransferase [Lacticaseibacillus paracasei]QHV91374.1 acyltransferase [Lacticaseibacillus paracasei]
MKKNKLRLRDWLLSIALGLTIAGVAGFFYVKHYQSEQAIAVNQSTRQRIQKDSKAKVKKEKVLNQYRLYGLTDSEINAAKALPVSAIGDSIMLGSSAYLKVLFPEMSIDAEVGRQVQAAPAIISQLKSSGKLANTVVISLGTNGPMTEADINGILDQLGTERQVFWVTAYAPGKAWIDPVNKLIHAAAKTHANLHVVDWYYLAGGNDDWFADDGVHPNDAGRPHYYTLIAKDVMQTLKK